MARIAKTTMFPTNSFEAGDALGAVTELQALLMTDIGRIWS